MIKKMKEKFVSLLLEDDGGKRSLNKRNSLTLAVSFFAAGILSQLVPSFFKNDNPRGSVIRSDTPLIKYKDESVPLPLTTRNKTEYIGGVSEESPHEKPKVVKPFSNKPIQYRGKQVIFPDSNTERIPSGSYFIGKFLTSIDTRSQQRVHVMLPYGGSNKTGGDSLPPETILMGQFNYSGQGKRVFIVFNRAVLPDGQEINVQAQALSSKDYRVGVIGAYHGNRGSQMASMLGLSMVSGVSEVMVEKQGFGQSYNIAPKSTIKNGLYNGLAKVTDMEANEQVAQLAAAPKYVTIDSGTDLIISIEESFGTNEQ